MNTLKPTTVRPFWMLLAPVVGVAAVAGLSLSMLHDRATNDFLAEAAVARLGQEATELMVLESKIQSSDHSTATHHEQFDGVNDEIEEALEVIDQLNLEPLDVAEMFVHFDDWYDAIREQHALLSVDKIDAAFEVGLTRVDPSFTHLSACLDMTEAHFRTAAYRETVKMRISTALIMLTMASAIGLLIWRSRRAMVNSNSALATHATQLEVALKELESFSYSVSHDLRSPLRGIDGWSLALVEDCGHLLDDHGQNHLNRIRTEAQRMSGIIDNLLDLARASRSKLVRENVDLSALANRIFASLHQSEPDRKVACFVQPGMIGFGDPILLEMLLQNLLENAWKFTGKRDSARIEFCCESTASEVTFIVRDNGAGFAMTEADKLFTPFNRLHKPSDFSGTGIGLAVVQRVLNRHLGQIKVKAAIDQGATFSFRLPVA